MSRSYEAAIEIKGIDMYSPTSMAVQGRLNTEWDWQRNWYKLFEHPIAIAASSKGSLCFGESEKEFVKRITQLVWKTAGTYLQVIVYMTYLEELPYNTYESDEGEYTAWLKSQPEPI